ncbi:phosphoribosylamine--glycine ligase [Nitrososphaera sp. AFS]|nr:phosphoribosylamine--glycine ligase [Nitrososphaera sp. AFS]
MRNQNVLIVGSGGREHALGWKLSKSDLVEKVYYASGNGGTSLNIDINPTDFKSLSKFARDHECFTVVGPEKLLESGIVDFFMEEDLPIFGPTKRASMLESSKIFSKQFMNANNIPTANFSTFSDVEKAKDYVVRQKDRKLVVKADGLSGGKGVVVCDSSDDAVKTLDSMMIHNRLGNSGQRVVIEERLFGEEASYIAICDGKTLQPLASSRDYKRLYNGDMGPNTGGMGSYSPTPLINEDIDRKILEKIMRPAISGMSSQGKPFRGFLYAGILVDHLSKEPVVLEFNVRMGDPECQPLMTRMNSDLFEYLQNASEGRLDTMQPINWTVHSAVCVIMASKGYPSSYSSREIIQGLTDIRGTNVAVFHSGTLRDEMGNVLTNGGRILGVCALGPNVYEASEKAYSEVGKIKWGQDAQYFRNDIGKSTLPN